MKVIVYKRTASEPMPVEYPDARKCTVLPAGGFMIILSGHRAVVWPASSVVCVETDESENAQPAIVAG